MKLLWAIIPSRDQAPIKSTHSKTLWPMWVVLIAIDRRCIRRCLPLTVTSHSVLAVISSLRRERAERNSSDALLDCRANDSVSKGPMGCH